MDYYALDLSLGELKRTFSEISPESFTHVGFHGLHGTYDDGLDWLKIPENRKRPTVVLSIGSSMGNFSPPGAAEFLGNFSKQLNPSDFMLIGLDACKNPEKVFNAYNDAKGVTRQFYENGLLHANRVLGFQAFKAGEWEVLTTYDPRGGRHQAFYAPKVDVVINGIKIAKGEKLVCEEAWKYGRKERDELWRKANLISEVEFGNSTEDYCEPSCSARIVIAHLLTLNRPSSVITCCASYLYEPFQVCSSADPEYRKFSISVDCMGSRDQNHGPSRGASV